MRIKIQKNIKKGIAIIIAIVFVYSIRILLLPEATSKGLEKGFRSIEDLYANSEYILAGSFNGSFEEFEIDLDTSVKSSTIYRLQEFEIEDTLKGKIDLKTIRIPDLYLSEFQSLQGIHEESKNKYREMKERFPKECIIFVDRVEAYGEVVFVVQNSFQSIINIDDNRLVLENRAQAIFMWIISKDHLEKKIEAMNRKYEN